jgi:soluble cytochrome b562
MDAAITAGLIGAALPTSISLIANVILYKQLHVYRDQLTIFRDQLSVMSASLENARSSERGQVYMMRSQIVTIQDELQDFIPDDALDQQRLSEFDLSVFHDFRALTQLISSPTVEEMPGLKAHLEEFADLIRDATRDIKVARRKAETPSGDLKAVKDGLQAIYLKCEDCLTKFPR